MQRGLRFHGRHCLLLALLLETTMLTSNAHKVLAVSNGNEGEAKLEKVSGPTSDRHYGINILDEHGEIIISDPSDRVLRALTDDFPNSRAMHKVKDMYKRLLTEEGEEAHDSLRHVVAEDKAAIQQNDDYDGSILSGLLRWIW